MRFRKFNHYIYNNIVNILPILSLSLLTLLIVNFILPSSNGNIGYNTEVVYAADANNPNKTTPTASLTVSNSGVQEINVQPNSGTIYSNHTVTIDSVNIANYTLSISGPATLSSVSGKTTLSGAGGASGNSLPDNTWGYYYNTNGITSESNYGSSNYSSFSGSNQTLESANGSPSSVERSLVLAAKFGDAAEPGHYAGQINLSLTAVPKVLTTYTITYNANSGSGAPSNWSDSSYDDSYTTTISSTTPTRSGYTFLGWNTSSTATSANSNYAAGTSITLTSSSATLNLVAVWEELGPEVSGFGGIKKMQDMTSSICSAASGLGQLYDVRDNSAYTVAKVGDACWMTQNLRLTKEGMAKKGNTILTSADSDVSDNYDFPDSTTAGFSNIKSRISDDDGATYKNEQVRAAATSDDGLTSDPNGITSEIGKKYGAYYSWCAVTAGTCEASGVNGVNAPSSICPKGWRLPVSGTDTANDFAKAAGISANVKTNANYWSSAINPSFINDTLTVNNVAWLAAGYVSESGLNDIGRGGRYWSSTSVGTTLSSTLSYFLNIASSNYIGPADYVGGIRYGGFSVRCIAK